MKSSHSLALDTTQPRYDAGGEARARAATGLRSAQRTADGNGGTRPERASRDATPFGPDVILPAQFYEHASTLDHASGEKALMLAVLEDGIRCFQEHLKNPRVRPRLLARQAERWIRSKDWEWPFSFNNVCESLELNPECLRARLLAPREDGAAPSKPRSSHRVYRLTPRVKPPRRR
ncbi:MAG TPA: hypothetical protein VFD92_05770 [Candidatus Binatia bacterium]|nr:hypothetical protein [Candidatus Binatia bacterium]